MHLEGKQVFFYCFGVIRCNPSVNSDAPEHQFTEDCGLSFAVFLTRKTKVKGTVEC